MGTANLQHNKKQAKLAPKVGVCGVCLPVQICIHPGTIAHSCGRPVTRGDAMVQAGPGTVSPRCMQESDAAERDNRSNDVPMARQQPERATAHRRQTHTPTADSSRCPAIINIVIVHIAQWLRAHRPMPHDATPSACDETRMLLLQPDMGSAQNGSDAVRRSACRAARGTSGHSRARRATGCTGIATGHPSDTADVS